MSGAIAEVQYDNDALISGTHKGPTGTTIIQSGKDFRSCGAIAGLAVRNTTDLTSGHIVSATEDSVVTDITFHLNDAYSIYHTGTYNDVISVTYTDRRYGRKVTDKNELIDGIFPEDSDVDNNDSHAWGPGQPERGGM
jgi:hypothetical protein